MKRLLWIVAVVTVAVCSTVPIIDPDIWWHITVGKWILAHSTVPHVDYWNMFWAGKPWRAYSWLCEVLFALVERGWGDHGLLSLKLCVAVLYCATLSAVFGRIARDYFLGTAVGFLVLCASAGNFTLRPQCLVWILFVLLFGLADTISREGLNTKRTAALFAVMMLWANLHITTILGLGTLAGWIARPGRWKVAAQSVGIAFVGTLFTPYFGGEWLTFRETAVHPVSFAAIAEFQPATILQYSTGLLALLGGMVWAIGGDRSARAYPLRFMLTGALLLGALAVVKFFPFAAIALGALLCAQWSTREPNNAFVGGVDRLRSLVFAFGGPGGIFLLGCIAAVRVHDLWGTPVNYEEIPKREVDWIQAHNLNHPILNTFGNGGYLIYRFSNEQGELERKVSIDGRTNVISAEVWNSFMDAQQGRIGWKKYIDLVNPQTILWRTESPFTSILLNSDDWCRVFTSGGKRRGYSIFISHEQWKQRPESDRLESENCGSKDPS